MIAFSSPAHPAMHVGACPVHTGGMGVGPEIATDARMMSYGFDVTDFFWLRWV